MKKTLFAVTAAAVFLSTIGGASQSWAQGKNELYLQRYADAALQDGNIVAGTDPLAPVPDLINGGFEASDYTGWIQGNNGLGGFCGGSTGVVTTTSGCWTWLDPTTPIEGTYEAMLPFDGTAGYTAFLYQDVEVPRCGTLVVNDRIQYDGSLGADSTLPRVYQIQVRSRSNAILEILHNQEELVVGMETDLGWQKRTFDLAAYGLDTVRIYFEVIIPETGTGPGTIVFDDLHVEDCAPTFDPATGILHVPWVDIAGKPNKSYEVELQKQPGVNTFDLLLPVTRR